ncbi:MAG: hypothetical protein ACJA0S_000705 [Rickettsiales bacterium]|jgi:hypothetical protein
MLYDYFSKNFYRLSPFVEKLAESNVVLHSKNSSTDHDENPFDLDCCSLFAIALSIFCDNYFLVGGEVFYNSKTDLNNKSLSPYASFFKGGNEKNTIHQDDKSKLIIYYNLVEMSFKQSKKKDIYFRLMSYYLKVVTEVPYQTFNVVKMGIPPMIYQEEYSIVNAAMLFEYIFTKEGRESEDGIDKWNQKYPNFPFSQAAYSILHSYRSTKVHCNATGAQKKVDKWKNENGDVDFLKKLNVIAITSSRKIIRGIAENIDTFEDYHQNLK